jgi:hypothetical protein
MPYSQAKVELSRVPEGTLKDTFIHFAEKHNALVEGANEMKQDLDQISGVTQAEKEETHTVMQLVRQATHYLHGKRFSVTLASLQAYLLLAILRQFDVHPNAFSQLLEAIISVLGKFATP